MKLRILGNKIRLRLTQNEIKQLEQGNEVAESVHFMNDTALQYAVIPSTLDHISTSFDANKIEVQIPSGLLVGWNDDSREGLYHQSQTGDEKMEVAIEKDYQCLHKRPGEDETDNYPHPAKASS